MNTIGSMNSFSADTQIASKTAKSGGKGYGTDHDLAAVGFDALMVGLSVPAPVVAPAQTQREPQQETLFTGQEANEANPAWISSLGQAAAALAQLATNSGLPSGLPSGQIAVPSDAQPSLPSGSVTSLNGAAQLQSAAEMIVANSQQLLASAPTGSASTTPASVQEGLLAQTGTDLEALSGQFTMLVDAGDMSEGSTLAALRSAVDLKTVPSIGVQPPATGSSTSPASTAQANAGITANAGANQSQQAEVSSTQVQPQTNGQSAPQAAQASTGLETAAKAKPIELDAAAKLASKNGEAAPITVEISADSMSQTSGETTTLTPEAPSRPTHLTPHTIPMLAATMMRRLESGAKQFSMRLDPPELGQVEVKLTVAADKKVRAIVSADRPEALADLVRSARELTRALQEAGLDLEENGLTFTLNDSAGDQGRNHQGHAHAGTDTKQSGLKLVADGLTEDTATPTKTLERTKSNDPFQSWQRARIALTA
jgi:flagellar hook-length control protein FliK